MKMEEKGHMRPRSQKCNGLNDDRERKRDGEMERERKKRTSHLPTVKKLNQRCRYGFELSMILLLLLIYILCSMIFL